jgi:hypothetical protein
VLSYCFECIVLFSPVTLLTFLLPFYLSIRSGSRVIHPALPSLDIFHDDTLYYTFAFGLKFTVITSY